MPEILSLTRHPNGNYVVQALIKNGTKSRKMQVLSEFKKDLLALSTDKYASNVIESTLRNCPYALKRELITEFLKEREGGPYLLKMARDKFGNYVI
jgi:hypothetical protein